MSQDTVVLELAFVRLPVADMAGENAIWHAADEQHFDPLLRRRLAENGLRVGLLGSQLPDTIREAFAREPNLLVEGGDEVDQEESREQRRGVRRLQCRQGRRNKVLASRTYSTLAVLTCEDGGLHGKHLTQAQCLFGLRAFPRGDGQVRLELTPEIEHGEMKNQWVGQEGALMQRVGKERISYDTLRMSPQLALGQTLVVGTTTDIKGLGEHFFSEINLGTSERVFLLVRLAQTQLDDIFSSGTLPATLTTNLD
jgi:hypothetical protein